MSFPVYTSTDKQSPHFTQLKTIGYFSLDAMKTIRFDSSNLSYYFHRSPHDEIHLDLNQGMEIVKRKTNFVADDKLNYTLKWIMNNFNQILANPESERWLYPDFICLRGSLIKIMKTPYDKRNRWIICAQKWRGSIYLCTFDTKEEKDVIANETEVDLKFTSYGFKFEQYMRSDDPNNPPDTSKPVDESKAFCCVFKSRLSDHRLLYGAEIDGLISDEQLTDPLPLDKLKFIEFKVCKNPENSAQRFRLKNSKFLHWWCQSSLVGIENIVCGFRDEKGIVTKLENYRVAELEKKTKVWKPSVALNFCDDFLKYVSEKVIDNYDQTIYIFERIPHEDIVLTEAPPSSVYSFLPDWYTKSKRE